MRGQYMLSLEEINIAIESAKISDKYQITCESEAYGSTLVEVHNEGVLTFRLHAFQPDFESNLNRRLGNLEKAPIKETVDAGFSKSVAKTLEKMYSHMGAKTQQGGVELLDKMVEKADANEAYAKNFISALSAKSGATEEIRALANSFGDYWTGVKHQNKVDAIDSAIGILHGSNKENDDLSL